MRAAKSPAPEPGGPGPEISVQFSRFAPYYDRFMNKYVNYRAWVQYVIRIFARYNRRPELVLDLACGSGIPTLLLAREGYRVIGVDRSEAMLNVLRAKVSTSPGSRGRASAFDIRAIRSDMREFELPEPVDAAICLYDSMNYLLTPDDLTRSFRAVHRGLKPAGLFVFDMNTIHGLATFWGNSNSVREVEDIYTIWQTTFDPDTRISTLHLTFHVWEGEQRVRYDEIHEERGYHLEEVDACLLAAGFNDIDFLAHGTFQPPGPDAARIMVVAQKKSNR